MYKIVENRIELERLVAFLEQKSIDESFVKPLSQRNISISDRVYSKYKTGKWVVAYDSYTNEVVGCCGLTVINEGVEVSTFVVSPECRGLGVGKKLLEMILDVAKKEYTHREIFLDSWEGSSIEPLILKHGFVFVKSFIDPLKRPEGIKTVVYKYQVRG